jgi:ubiquinone/menaquinone biosynthesis C-methylase UbiE
MSIYAAAKWEAPDRKFFGHRDCIVRNMSRYHFIAPRAKGRCLDIGCGRGYGFDCLKPKCESCTGLDISETFLEEARAQYPGVSFVHQNAERLPFDDASFDTIINFEVIEHIEDDRAFLREIVRVAAPGALVAISTPNRLIASGGREKPLNKFHVREYAAEEFRNLLAGTFAEVMLYGQSEARASDASARRFPNSFINRIPVQVKYLIPFYVQDVLSVMLRPPLKLEDCRFDLNTFKKAHTLYAVCRFPV